jgi:predicted acetyltransferase
MEIRKITEAERRTVSGLYRYAFGGWTDEVPEDSGGWTPPDETLGVFDEGKLVSAMTVVRFQQSVRGVLKGMGGIAGVASYPEGRRQGRIRELFKAAFLEMRQRNLPVSMLSAFKRSFYAQFGYVTADCSPLAKTSARNLASAVRVKSGIDWEFERLRAIDAKETFLDFVQKIAPSRYHGFVTKPDISDQVWKWRNANALVVLAKAQGALQAVARYRIKLTPAEEEPIQSIVVHEMYWRTLDARDALFSYFARHADQMATITFYVPFTEHFEQWFPDAWWELRLWESWMVRVVDVEQALLDLPGTPSGSLVVHVSDDFCDWNTCTYRLKAEGGRIQVKRGGTSPRARFSIEGLSALVYGTLPLEEIEHKGWATVEAPEDRELLLQWFPPRPIFNAYGF